MRFKMGFILYLLNWHWNKKEKREEEEEYRMLTFHTKHTSSIVKITTCLMIITWQDHDLS